MALPVAGEVWEASTTSEDGGEFDAHSHKYYVDEIVTRFGGVQAKIRMVDNADSAGFYKYVLAAYMDNSAVWSKFV